jgi:predicted ester cyclase
MDRVSAQHEVAFTGIVIYRLENGKIVESWAEIDFSGLWRQLTT